MTTIDTQINDLYAIDAVQDLSHDAAATVQAGGTNGARIVFNVKDDESTYVTVRGRNQHGEMTTWHGKTWKNDEIGGYSAGTSDYWWVGDVTVSYMKDGDYRQIGGYVNKFNFNFGWAYLWGW